MIWILYFLVGITHLFAIYFKIDALIISTKVLLMPLLVVIAIRTIKPKSIQKKLIIALVFSWFGDILLIRSDNFVLFISGIGTFLVAQLMYSNIFYTNVRTSKSRSFVRVYPIVLIPIVAYMFLLLSILIPNLGDLVIPIIIYTLAINSMLILAINRKFAVSENAFYFVLFGAIMFVLSDSGIAYNKFYKSIPHSRILIMLTYILAQGLIVKGLAMSNVNIDN